MTYIKSIFLALCLAFSSAQILYAEIHQQEDVKNFINEMINKHGFDKDFLESVFSRARISNSILDAISRPAEAMPWYKYRDIFIRRDRIQLGRKFIDDHQALLIAAEEEYGVPPEIIAAIIGVETRYGKNTGSYKVIDSLVTLGFRYPKRASFFRSELEQFLLLAREQDLDPHTVKGSYAGAMGIPQFISSSYRHYAVDFDKDGTIDIWGNPADAIGSVANYFKMHGWKKGQKIALRVSVTGSNFEELIDTSLEPDRTISELSHMGIIADDKIDDNTNARLLKFKQEINDEYWLGLENFYVITRYNHSALYAMAVYQLSQEISGNPVD